jgi:hypothetical protein
LVPDAGSPTRRAILSGRGGVSGGEPPQFTDSGDSMSSSDAEGRQALILDGVLRAGARIGPDPRLILDQAYLIKRSHDTPKKGIKFIYYDF